VTAPRRDPRTHDRLGRQVRRVMPAEEATEIADTFFDGRGDPYLVIDERGYEIESTFDAAGRVTQREIFEPDAGPQDDPVDVETFLYDGLGRVRVAGCPASQTSGALVPPRGEAPLLVASGRLPP